MIIFIGNLFQTYRLWIIFQKIKYSYIQQSDSGPNELHLASIYYEKIFWSINLILKFFIAGVICKNYYCKINCFLLYFLKVSFFNTNHNIIILLHIILYSVNYLPINWTVSHLYILVCLIISQHINSGKTVIYQLK